MIFSALIFENKIIEMAMAARYNRAPLAKNRPMIYIAPAAFIALSP